MLSGTIKSLEVETERLNFLIERFYEGDLNRRRAYCANKVNKQFQLILELVAAEEGGELNLIS